MALFDFLKMKKEEKTDNKFVGRHQQILFIRQILGEDVPDLEMQIAANKDLGERNEILEKLEKLEEYMHSDYFTNQFDVSSASKEIDEVINQGYKTCVLPNDFDLENRCLKIHKDITEYAKKIGRKNGTLDDDKIAKIDKILDMMVAAGFLNWMTLEDKLKTSDEQHAWMIKSSLVFSNKPVGGFNKSNLVKDVLATLSLKDLQPEVERFREMKKRLLEKNQITTSEARRIDELIEQGVSENKRIHEQYPDRP